MYTSITDVESLAKWYGKECPNTFIIGFYKRMAGNCLTGTLLLDVCTAEEVGQLLGGN